MSIQKLSIVLVLSLLAITAASGQYHKMENGVIVSEDSCFKMQVSMLRIVAGSENPNEQLIYLNKAEAYGKLNELAQQC